MRRSIWPLATESLRVAAASRVVSALIALLALAIPLAVLGATGLNIEGQRAVLRRVDEIGTRIVTVVAGGQEQGIPSGAVERIARLPGVEWVVGLGPVFDVRNRQPTGEPTPVRAYRAVGAPVAFSSLTEATGAYLSETSARRAGLGGAYSMLDPGALAVVGWFQAAEPLRALEAFILVPGEREIELERVIVAASDVGGVEPIANALPAMIGESAAQGASVQRSGALLEARESVRAEINRQDRALVVALLLGAMVMAAAVVFAGTVAARRDFGRRRALGATRLQLTLLVLLGTLWPASIGAALGVLAGWGYLGSRLGVLPDWRYPVAIGTVTIMGLVAASIFPAAVAATRDPLRVLRVP